MYLCPSILRGVPSGYNVGFMIQNLVRWGICLMLGLISLPLSAQVGYVNLDAILDIMPETQTMRQELEIFERRRMQQIQPRLDSFQREQAGLQAAAEAGLNRDSLVQVAAGLDSLRASLLEEQETLKQQIQVRQAIFETEIYNKITRQLDVLCEEEGYTYIFNSQASGNSIFLHSPAAANLSRELIKRLQIPLEE